jgi:hypothetical protein
LGASISIPPIIKGEFPHTIIQVSQIFAIVSFAIQVVALQSNQQFDAQFAGHRSSYSDVENWTGGPGCCGPAGVRETFLGCDQNE